MKVGILYSRVRAEEKLLFEEFDKRGVELDLIDDGKLVFDITDNKKDAQFDGYDVVVERCISHGRALYSLRMLNDRGVKTVNTALVADNCEQAANDFGPGRGGDSAAGLQSGLHA